ncbi:MAG: Hsp20/alpha crystallin family protein [Prochlorococcaceae cyanobacterium]
MRSLHSSSAFDLFDRLEQQLSQQLHPVERVPAAELVPAAEVRESSEAYVVVLELPGVTKDGIEVKATDRTLVISAERRSQPEPTAEAEARAPLMSEFRYGTWGRSFRFPQAIDREQLEATYRDGLLTVMAPKANKQSTVTVRVAG